MNIEDIKKNKPDGATHYVDNHGVKYYKLDHLDRVCIYNKSDNTYECLNLHILETVCKPLN